MSSEASCAAGERWEGHADVDPDGLGELRDRFATQGYLHMRGILSHALVGRLSDLLSEAFEAQSAAFERATGACLGDSTQVDALLSSQLDPDAWFLSQPRPMQHLLRGEFPLSVRLHADFLRLAEEQSLTHLLAALLGEDSAGGLRLNYPPMLRFKVQGMSQSEVPLHQDGPYFSHIRDFATVWIPMCPITEECGGINVLEGSHRCGPIDHDEGVLWGRRVPWERRLGAWPDRHILMEPGDALIFGPHLLHYSHANVSQRVRCSIDSRWFGSGTSTSRQYYDLRHRQVVRMF